MKLSRVSGFCLLALLTLVYVPYADAHGFGPPSPHVYHGSASTDPKSPRSSKGDAHGIRELIPQEAKHRYAKWKEELLSTEYGRAQWDHYANNKNFLLTIVVSKDRKFGAGTDDFEWNKDGELIAAKITLGLNLDKGYPDPVYYPVMNSLSTYDTFYEVSGDILASTKLAHEIGHVNFTAEANGKLFERQNRLMDSYNSIFLKNGYNTRDPRLVALADELGAKPIEIWEAREYKSEASALRYLVERINREPYYCSVFTRVRRNIANHASNYQEGFADVVDGAKATACQN